MDTPVHIAVEGDRAFIRTYGKALKTKRLGRDPRAVLWLASTGTRPAILSLTAPQQVRSVGSGVRVCAHALAGDEPRRAGRALARKYPILHGLLIPWVHRFVYRTSTMNFELTSEA